MKTLAAIEAGGTKWLCGVATLSGELRELARIPTTTPVETLTRAAGFFADAQAEHGGVVAGGIASFGPLDLEPRSQAFGTLTTTPKHGWSGVDVLGSLGRLLAAPVRIDTDVVCAAVAEGLWGAAKGLGTFAYVTIGTGLGVGVLSHGKPVTGYGHAEIGHMRVARPASDLGFPGSCPFHGDCVEGLACGPAIAARWGASPEELPDGHPAWALEAEYVATLCANLVYTVRPERIVIGGGVLAREGLLSMIRARLARLLGGYALSKRERDLSTFIAAPASPGGHPGLLGAVELARSLARERR